MKTTAQKINKFYVIETHYAGPNPRENPDADLIEICSSLEGMTFSHMHGEYSTLEAARAAITEIFGDVRDCDPQTGDPFPSYSEATIEVYRPGRYTPMDEEGIRHTAFILREDVTPATTDEALDELVGLAEEHARDEYMSTCGERLEEALYKYRTDARLEVLSDWLEDIPQGAMRALDWVLGDDYASLTGLVEEVSDLRGALQSMIDGLADGQALGDAVSKGITQDEIEAAWYLLGDMLSALSEPKNS